MEKQYFIKDESLQSVDQDYFGHADLANNIRMMIDHTQAPFNIAIIGKWGMGKSSLINMVTKSLQQDTEGKYLVQEINAWKYQKEDFGRAFLKQLYQTISGEEITTRVKFEQILGEFVLKSQTKKDPETKNKKRFKETLGSWKEKLLEWKSYIAVAFLILLVSFLLFMGYKAISLRPWEESYTFLHLLFETFVGYCKNVVVVFVIPLIIWFGKIYMDQVAANRNMQIGINIPMESRDDYEFYLKSVLKKEDKKHKKIVTVIDDLDRLDAKRIVEALDALKIFMDMDNCIFIVPFDDAILKNALENNRLKNMDHIGDNVTSELILDKLFQYKVYIPEIVKINIKDYAVQLFKENCKDFINQYMNGDVDGAELLIRNVIIHNNVKTPRQVKKLLNAFINNMMIAVKRERTGRVEKGFATNPDGMKLLAKISVLQADFNEFYDLLFVNSNAMEELLASHNGKTNNIPDILYPFFEEGKSSIRKEFYPLINYLTYTEKYNVKSIIPYLYMAQDEISVLTGDKKQQSFMEAVLSKNVRTVRDMLNEIPALAKALQQFITVSDEVNEVTMACIIAINIFNDVENQYRQELITAITLRLNSCIDFAEDSGIDWIDYDNLFMVQSESAEPEIYDKIIQYYINNVLECKKDVLINIFHKMLLYKNSLSEISSNILKQKLNQFVTGNECEASDVRRICENVDEKVIRSYMDIVAFEYIAKDMLENEEFDKHAQNEFKRFFRLYITKENIQEYIKILVDMVKFPQLHGLTKEILTEELLVSLDILSTSRMAWNIVGIPSEKCLPVSYKLLLSLPYEINNNEKVQYDSFMRSLISSNDFVEMIHHFMKYNNDLSLLNDTIENLSTDALADSDALDRLCQISKYYTASQKDFLFVKLKSLFIYVSNKKYEREKEILHRLYNDSAFAGDIIRLVKELVIPNINSYCGRLLYLNFAIYAIEEVKDELGQANLDKVARIYLSQYTLYPVEVVNTFNNIGSYLSDGVRLEAKKTLKKVVLDEVLEPTATFIFNNSDMDEKDNSNDTDLVEFIAEYLDKLSDKVRAIKKLESFYPTLSWDYIKKISSKLCHEPQILNDVAEPMSKFYNFADLEQLTDLAIDLTEEENANTARGLLCSNKSKRTYEDIVDYAAQNAESYNKDDLLILIDMVNLYPENHIQSWELVMKAFLNGNQEIEANERALKDIQDKLQLGLINRDSVVNLLLKIFSNTSSEVLQKNIVIEIKKQKLTRRFKSLLGDKGLKQFEKIRMEI